MRKIGLLITVCLAAGALAARAADAKENWEKQCLKCHGADGKGETAMGKKLKVKDYTDAKVQASMKDEEIVKMIKEGKKEGDKTLMKAYAETFSEAEIKDLVAYVRKFKKKSVFGANARFDGGLVLGQPGSGRFRFPQGFFPSVAPRGNRAVRAEREAPRASVREAPTGMCKKWQELGNCRGASRRARR